jgi:hypothetical protein
MGIGAKKMDWIEAQGAICQLLYQSAIHEGTQNAGNNLLGNRCGAPAQQALHTYFPTSLIKFWWIL